MDETEEQYMKWALVLSGGGAKGMAHVGVFRALETLKMRPSLVVGCSMGAIIGGLYCSGMSVAEMADWLEYRFDLGTHMDLSHMDPPDTRLWKLLKDGPACRSMAERPGLDRPDSVFNLFRDLTGGCRFEDARIPFAATAVDLLESRPLVMDSGDIATAIRASMAIPGVFAPVVHDGAVLVDGGIWDNMPVAVAREKGFERVVAVNVTRPLKPEHLRDGMSILAAAVWVAGRKPERRGRDAPTVEIRVNVDVSDRDFDTVGPYIDAGERAALEAVPF